MYELITKHFSQDEDANGDMYLDRPDEIELKDIEAFAKEVRAEVISEILEFVGKHKQLRSTALECQGSHNEIVYINTLKPFLRSLG